MRKVFVVEALRTAIGSFGGALAQTTPVDLGAAVAKEILGRSGGVSVDELILGNVLGAGHGMNLARQVAIKSGLPVTAPAYTVNKVCGSGMKAIGLAFQAIASGEADCIIAGGVESMSQAGHVSLGARWGTRMGPVELKDLMLSDGLTDVFNSYHMGITAENLAERYSISRQEQDSFAAESQRRAAAAQAEGRFSAEIVPVPLFKKGAQVGAVERDEYVRPDTTVQSLAKLSPAFKKDGTVTAGNASGINDGAALLMLASESYVKQRNLTARAQVLGVASAGVDPAVMGIGPVPAVQRLLEKLRLELGSVDCIEANEAFAVQALAVARELKLDSSRVNVNGGAIALGHPIGASGARIVVTLLHELQRSKKSLGLATLCVGGGQGIALMLQRC